MHCWLLIIFLLVLIGLFFNPATFICVTCEEMNEDCKECNMNGTCISYNSCPENLYRSFSTDKCVEFCAID